MTARKNLPFNFRARTALKICQRWWRKLITPLSTSPIDAQREYILRVILLLGQLSTYPATVAFFIGAYTGLFPAVLPITLALVSFSLSGAWLLTTHNHWRTARFVVIILPYAVATFIGEKYTMGMVSGLLYAQAIFVTAILARGFMPWLVTAIIGITIIGITWLRMAGFIPPDVRYDEVFGASSISILFSLMLLVILAYFFVDEYQQSFTKEHRQSKLLEETNQRLTTEIEQRKTVETKLQASLQEKEILLREIHHRVKNNLQTIASLLYLQTRYTNQPDALEALQNSYDRVQSMALIHQHLYQNTDLGHIDLEQYIAHLLQQLRQSYRSDARIRFFADIEPVQFNLDTVIPIGLIITELVSNAMKHAFPDNQPGEIHVVYHQTDTHRILTVFDTGVGLSAKQKDNLALNGVAGLAKGSLGLTLIQKLTGQLHGSFTVTTEPHTAFTVTF